jgi:hypothetical protein
MSEWTTAIIVGVVMASPALIAAIFNYYKNKADIAETYEGIAHRCAKELEEERAKNKILRQKNNELMEDMMWLKQGD